MDYKINMFAKNVDADQDIFPEVSGLHFAVLNNGQAVAFDADLYLEENGLEPLDVKVFMRLCKRFIENIIRFTGTQPSHLFYQTPNGHILMAADLTFLYMSFVNPEMCNYLNQLAVDIMRDGQAFSNGFVYEMARDRLSTELLKDILKDRDEQGGD